MRWQRAGFLPAVVRLFAVARDAAPCVSASTLTLPIVIVALTLAACGKKPPVVVPQTITVYQPVEVLKPIPVKAPPPAELLTTVSSPLPVFVAPSDPLASSALTVDGERVLRALLEELLATIQAWKTWATAP